MATETQTMETGNAGSGVVGREAAGYVAEIERLDMVTRLNACLLEGDTSAVDVESVRSKIDDCLERRFKLMQDT